MARKCLSLLKERSNLQFQPSGVQIIMAEKHTPLRSLLEELRNAPQGAIEGHAKYKVIHLLANCWHELEGAGETAMQARKKLDRAEDVSWNPPVLSFTIERHGMSTDHRCNSAHGRLVPGEGYSMTFRRI